MRRILCGVGAALAAGGLLVWSAAGASGTGMPPRAHEQSTVGRSAGPFVTLLFSRTELNAAVKCVPLNTGVAQLSTVAADLARQGMAGTGTLVTSRIRETGPSCGHYGESLMASWSDAKTLAATYGWKFVSHTATYPKANLDSLPADVQQAETCGSAQAIDAHGLPGGHGLIAYPGAYGTPQKTQRVYGSQCFAWGRLYGFPGITNAGAGNTPPFWQRTVAVDGGACTQASAKCHFIKASGRGPGFYYEPPADFVAQVKGLHSGQWMSIQAYILVTGKNISGAGGKWDCTSTNVNLHWTNDNERYCYVDYQKIISAIASTPAIRVTDPLSVGIAFGRPGTYSK